MVGYDEVVEELRALRGRVATLEADNERLRVSRPSGEGPSPATQVLTRRDLVKRAGLAAAGGAGLAVASALVAASPAAAGTDGDVVLGGSNDSFDAGTDLFSRSASATLGVVNEFTRTGSLSHAIYGATTLAANTAAAVRGVAAAANANGVQGETTGATASGVYGQNDGGGYGVAGRSNRHATGNVAGVLGDNVFDGPGVQGSSVFGPGAKFLSGSGPQVRLQPSSLTTHPTKGKAGDLFVDSAHRLWFCQGGTTWKQLA